MEIVASPKGRSKDRPLQPQTARDAKTIRVGFIGAGNYARAHLLPALKADVRVRLVSIANARGISAKKVAEEFAFARCTTDASKVLRDSEIDAVFIATRHDLHGPLAAEALEAGKAVFVEKPLCLSEVELARIVSAHKAKRLPFMLGHNRRFALATQALREFFAGARPLNILYTVHAGPLPEGYWLRNPAQGGRILGEVCHFVDWCFAMIGAPVTTIAATKQGEFPDEGVHALLSFADGSEARIEYDCAGAGTRPKELIEISAGERTATLTDFVRGTFVSKEWQRTMTFHGKGQAEMIAAFLAGIASGKMPVEFEEWVASARATLRVASGE